MEKMVGQCNTAETKMFELQAQLHTAKTSIDASLVTSSESYKKLEKKIKAQERIITNKKNVKFFVFGSICFFVF